jgi:hypothetical protein
MCVFMVQCLVRHRHNFACFAVYLVLMLMTGVANSLYRSDADTDKSRATAVTTDWVLHCGTAALNGVTSSNLFNKKPLMMTNDGAGNNGDGV